MKIVNSSVVKSLLIDFLFIYYIFVCFIQYIVSYWKAYEFRVN